MATVKARGQITIVDLNDAKQISVYLESDSGYIQLYNTGDKSYTPDYTSSNLKITPMVMVTGQASSQIARCSSKTYEIIDDGTKITLTEDSPSATGYVMDSNGVLTISKNITGNSLSIKFSATYTDGDTGAETQIMAYTTIIKSSAGDAVFQAIIVTPKGTIFTESGLTQLTAECNVYRGSTRDTSGTTFTWYYLDVSTASWLKVTDLSDSSKGTVETTDNESTLTVNLDNILNFQTYKCVAEDDGSTAEALVTFQDLTDPYTLELFTATGDKILNGVGSTVVNARIYQGGELVEDENTSPKVFTYSWTKYNSSGEITAWTGANATGSTNNGCTIAGNPITVYATDVTNKVTIYCEVSK